MTLAAFSGVPRHVRCVRRGSCRRAQQARERHGSGCIAHHPNYIEGAFEVQYAAGCSGHDEPELDPVSCAPGSAQNLTWRFVLPSDGAFPVSATGPTFWFGGTVTDPNPACFGQAFLEVQFYPDAIVTNCTPNGGFVVSYAPNTYTVCSPVWSHPHDRAEAGLPRAGGVQRDADDRRQAPAARHARGRHDRHSLPRRLAANEGWHIDVTDETTGGTGTIVLEQRRRAAAAGVRHAGDRQLARLGHRRTTPRTRSCGRSATRSPFTHPASQFCIPGRADLPVLQRAGLGRDLADPDQVGHLRRRLAPDALGDGLATRAARPRCSATRSSARPTAPATAARSASTRSITQGSSGVHYGSNFPNEINDLGGVDQFAQTLECGGPFGPNSTYCDTLVPIVLP